MQTRGKVLVTGGAGFIGSHLVERLLNEGYEVSVVDDCSTGSLANLDAVRSHASLSLHEGKVSAWPDLEKVVAESAHVFHLAAAVGVELVVSSPVATIQTNLDETKALLELASRHGTPVVLASTSEVYGKSVQPEFRESDDLQIGPPHLARWGYACSKLMDEFMAMAYHRERQLPVTIARFFNTVGPRQTGRYGMVLPRFIQAAFRNESLRVYGSGEQTRCFCYVQDTVEALMRLMCCPAALGEIVNIGSTEEVSIRELAVRVIELLGSAADIKEVPYEEAYAAGFEDMVRRRPCVEKLEVLTGFRPRTSLADIIRLTAESIVTD